MGEEDKCVCQCRLEELALEVRKVTVTPGDVLHVKVGGWLGEGMPEWVPSSDDLAAVQEELEGHLPEGVTAYVTHHLVDINTIVRPE